MGNELAYAGRWRRLFGVMIDAIALLPLTLGYNYLRETSTSITEVVLYGVISTGLWYAYNVYMHGRFGASLGKMALNMKVVDSNGSPITYDHAFSRYILALFAGTVLLAQDVLMVWVIPADVLPTLTSFAAQVEYVTKHNLLGYVGLLTASASLVGIVDAIAIFFNSRRRTLHDIIGGTVVIRYDHEEDL